MSDHCENPFCAEALDVDHVTLITTAHVRRFCSVECLSESHRHHMDVMLGYTTEGVRGPSTPPEFMRSMDEITVRADHTSPMRVWIEQYHQNADQRDIVHVTPEQISLLVQWLQDAAAELKRQMSNQNSAHSPIRSQETKHP